MTRGEAEVISSSDRFNFPGTYSILFYLPSPITVTVGRLGNQEFQRGWYFYVGSAQGPGGVAARVGHHLRHHSRPHWHLDYLRPWMCPRAVWAAPSRREHEWVALLQSIPTARFPMKGFGASDCRCPSHLIYFSRRPAWKRIKNALNSTFPHDPPLEMIKLISDPQS